MRFGGLVIAFLLILSAGIVRAAGPVLLEVGDDRGKEVRAVAQAFWSAVAAGDVPKAKSLFVGETEYAQLIDAYVSCFAEFDATFKAIKDHAIDLRISNLPAVRAMSQNVGGVARDQAGGVMLLAAGDHAWIARTHPFFSGTRLEKFPDGWKVTALAATARRATQLRTYIEACTRYAHGMTAAVNNGKTGDDRVTQPLTAAMERAKSVAGADLAGKPECESLPAPTPLASADAIAALLGTKLGDDSMRRLIASLPGLPRVSESETRLDIISDETGVMLRFDGVPIREAKLYRVVLCAIDNDIGHAYRGKLPCNLTPTMRRGEVEQLLGPPEVSGGGVQSLTYFADHVTRGLLLEYAGMNPLDPENSLDRVSIQAPREFRLGAITRPAGAAPATTTWPRLTIRAVEEDPERQAGAVEVDMLSVLYPQAGGGAPLAVRREILLDGRSIAAALARVVTSTNQEVISLTMTPLGKDHLKEATGRYFGHSIAVVVDGQILSVLKVDHVYSDELNLSIPEGCDSREQRVDLFGHLHAAVNALLPPGSIPRRTLPTSMPVLPKAAEDNASKGGKFQLPGGIVR